MAISKKQKADLPSTLQRSPEKAQDTYAETLDSAEQTYDGDERAAHRVAYGALKHSFEKVGDHWEPKEGVVRATGSRLATAPPSGTTRSTPRAGSTPTPRRPTSWTWPDGSTSTAGPR